ncbi:MAG TPA: AMP-binding protein, partial [Thermoanaerobaculia bacterium]
MNHQRPSELRSLVRLIEWRAEHVPDRVALSAWAGGGWRELTYQALWRNVESLGSSLIAHGVARGDRVVLRSESRPEWGVAFFAILYAGAIAVPVDPRIDEGELQRIVEHCGARLILTSTTTMAPASISEPRDRPDDVAVIAYTSGTMGNPKGVMITTASLLYEIRSLSAVHDLKEDDVFLSILPLNHLLELTCGLLSVLYAGGEVLYAGTLLPADLAEKMQTRGVTSMIAVPALYRTLKKTVES